MLCVQRRAQQLSLVFLGGTGCPSQLCLLTAVTQKPGFLSYESIQELGEWLSKQVAELRSLSDARFAAGISTAGTPRPPPGWEGLYLCKKAYPKCNRPVTRIKSSELHPKGTPRQKPPRAGWGSQHMELGPVLAGSCHRRAAAVTRSGSTLSNDPPPPLQSADEEISKQF